MHGIGKVSQNDYNQSFFLASTDFTKMHLLPCSNMFSLRQISNARKLKRLNVDRNFIPTISPR